MSIDADLFPLAPAALTGAAALSGVILQWVLDGRRRSADVRAHVTRERQARVREWNVRRIEATRSELGSLMGNFSYSLEHRRTAPEHAIDSTGERLLANAILVGDLRAIRISAEAVAAILSKLPTSTLVRAAKLGLAWPYNRAERNGIERAQALLLNALEVQQERALRDEDLVVLDVEAIQREIEASGLSAELDRLRL